MKKKKTKIIVWILAVVLFCGLGSFLYLQDYYRASDSAVAVLANSEDKEITITEEEDLLVFYPKNPKAGMVFYPGGKVEDKAYAPLMKACAERGILAILVHMPGNLAILDVNAAAGIIEKFPEISKWYLGGHSLGGAAAAMYISKNISKYQGLILLAAYSTKDIHDSKVQVLSMYGSEDQVLDMKKYQECTKNLPSDYEEMVIEGGCHAGFGEYGAQKKDGIPKITSQEQITITAEKIADMINE